MSTENKNNNEPFEGIDPTVFNQLFSQISKIEDKKQIGKIFKDLNTLLMAANNTYYRLNQNAKNELTIMINNATSDIGAVAHILM